MTEKTTERDTKDTKATRDPNAPTLSPAPVNSPHKPWDEAYKDIEAETKAYRDAQQEQRDEQAKQAEQAEKAANR